MFVLTFPLTEQIQILILGNIIFVMDEFENMPFFFLFDISWEIIVLLVQGIKLLLVKFDITTSMSSGWK